MTTRTRARSLGLSTGLAGCLVWLSPRLARAEDSVSYKYMDYRESGGRIAVQTQSALVEQDLGTDLHVKVSGVIDAIAGATPTGQPAPAGSDQVVLADIHDRRKAWNLDFSRQFPSTNVALGFAHSRESDYVSTGWSVNTLTDFNRKNTTLLAGVAGTDDDVQVFYQSAWARKRTNELIIGITQLLDPLTSVTLDVTWSHATGYLGDPYKVVQKRTEVNPGDFLNLQFLENRPRERDKWTAFASLNRAFPAQHAALEASVRGYHDTFGLNAGTVELTWLQRLGEKLVVQPTFRFYQQGAADFYYYQLDGTPIVPLDGPPDPHGPLYSSDYRLSAFRATTCGLKVVWTPTARVQLDAAVARYDMRGTDGPTPASAYPRAIIVSAGFKFSW